MVKTLALIALVGLVLVAGCQGASYVPGSSTSSVAQGTPTSSPAADEFEKVYRQFEYYSSSVELAQYASGQKVELTRSDPRYAEFIRAFFYSINAPGFERIAKGGQTGPATTVPYVLGYILTFKLLDGSSLVFNASTDNVWFETRDFTYKLPFSQDLRAFLQELLNHPEAPTLLPIPIQPAANEFLFQAGARGMVLKSVSVRPGILDKDYHDIFPPGTTAKKGEPCLLMTGQIESQLEQDYYVTMVARSYNAAGEQVAHTLDSGPISGVISVFLPAKGLDGFIIHLNAAPDVVRVELDPSDRLYDIPPP